jgi:stage II sporulation protein D
MVRRALLAAAVLSLAVSGTASAMLLGPDTGPAKPPKTTGGSTTAATATTATTGTTSTSVSTETATTAVFTETTATTTSPAPTPALPAPVLTGTPSATFLISGHGWGHGLGMSQWGARGYAQHGWTFDRILAHYYPGTQLGPASVSKVRVLLADGVKSLTLGSTGAWGVVDGAGRQLDLDPGELVLGPALRLTAAVGADPAPLTAPLSFVPRSGPLLLAGKPYRGSIQVSKGKDGKLQAVNVVGLEDYLKGVVPAEMPPTWPAEALETQAVAARSYALANRSPAKPYDLFADVRSQMYLGVSGETAATSAAVDATAGQVLLYKGQVADTLFSASSGGRTASWSEAFLDSKPVPYLVSVLDPYDLSPYRNWGPVVVDGAKAAKALKLQGPLEDIEPVIGPSGRVVTATLSLPAGPIVVSGSELRGTLGLRSTWLTIGLLSLQGPAAPLTYGQTTTLAGIARGVDAPLAEIRSGSVFWTPGPPVEPSADGSFALVVKPLETTDYRLGTGSLRGAPVRVRVAPAVKLLAGLSGTVRPAVPDTSIDIQVRSGTAWATVASVPVDASGAFAAGDLGSGTFRARYAPGGTLVAGISSPLVVP